MIKVWNILRQYGPPAGLVAAGSVILYAQAMNLNWIEFIWPIFIMLPGLPLLYVAWQAEEAARVRLIFPGAIITGTGIILQFQVITGLWRSWTYAWALYAVIFGMGLIFQGRRLNVKSDIRTGRLMVAGGAGAFIVLWMLFEAVVFSGIYSGLMGYMLAGLMIGAGVVWGLNRFRVARVLDKAKVIHAEPPTDKPRTVDELADKRARDVQAQLEARRRGAGSGADSGEIEEATVRELPAGEEPAANAEPPQTSGEPAERIAVADDMDEADDFDDEIAYDVEEEADADYLLTEYRPPTVKLDDGEAPKADIDPDLQAKIDAALRGEDKD